MKKFSFIALYVVTLVACGTSKKVAEDNGVVRWPDFLREWAADYEINTPQRMAVIDQIDTLYQLVEDSTKNTDLLCEKLCSMQNTISDAIVHDSSLVFPLMMRATARNFYGRIANNPWLLEMGCGCNVLDYLVADAVWYTSSRENLDIMYTTFIGLSWQVPERFATLMLAKEDGSELSTAILLVYNYTDTIIDNLQITFIDPTGEVFERLTEDDTYVDSPEKGIKRMMLPPYLVMNALVNNGTIAISYDTPQDTPRMVGFPHIYFKDQIEDCPRLKQILNQALNDNE